MKFAEFTGLRNDRPDERFEAGDLSVAQNVDIDNSGSIARRDGRSKLSAGAKHSLWADDSGSIGLFVAGNTLYQLNPDLSYAALLNGLTPDVTMRYLRVLDRVYFTNGHESGVIEHGAVRSWGLHVPPLPAVTLTVGSMPAGSYQYTLTYMRNDGQESGAAISGRIDLANDGGGLQFNFPVSDDSSVSAKNLYLSNTNGEILYWAMQVPNTQTSALYANDTSELVLPIITQFLSAPPHGSLLGYYRGHLYVAVGDTLFPSEEFAYEQFDLRKGIALDGKVTLFAVMDDADASVVFVGTDRSCGVLAGKNMSDFQYMQKLNYGVVDGTITYIDGSLYGDGATGARMLPTWLSAQGICVGLPNMQINNLTRTKFDFPVGRKGAAIFIPQSNKLIMSSCY